MKKFLYVILILFCGFTPCFAGTYYVDFVRGDNSNNGTSSSTAWKECPGTQNPTDTSTGGWVTIPVGSTIYFTAGQTWSRPILVSSSNFASPSQESERITLTSTSSSNRAIIDVSGYTSNDYIIKLSRNYITVQYFELKNLSNSGVPQGIYNSGTTYFKILHNYIHDIQDSSGDNSYGLEFDGGGNGEIAYNVVGNVEEKAIELYRCDDTAIHHNVCFTSNSFGLPTDHGVVISGAGNSFYDNIIYAEDGVRFRANPSYAFKVDGNSASDSFANSNKVYNNLAYGWPCGIGAIDTHDNIYANNTIYAKNVSVNSDSYDNHGIRISNANSNIFRNNIFYYVALTHNSQAHFGFFAVPSSTCANNIITNNIFYRSGTTERFRVGGTVSITLATMEGTSMWNGRSGNVMANNIVAAPSLEGGNHPVSDLPTGFDSDWRPNLTGLYIMSISRAINVGYDLSDLYNTDIAGNNRYDDSAWDIGAYEYSGELPPESDFPSPPSGLKILTQ